MTSGTRNATEVEMSEELKVKCGGYVFICFGLIFTGSLGIWDMNLHLKLIGGIMKTIN